MKPTLFFFTTLFIITSCKTKSRKIASFKKNVKLSYELQSKKCDTKLIVKIDGKEKTLVDYSENLKLEIVLIDDFNNDGNLDILLQNVKGCKSDNSDGYSIEMKGDSYFIFTTNGDIFFRTKEVGNDWGTININVVDAKLNFKIETTQKSYYKENEEIPITDIEEVYLLNNYALERVSFQEKRNIEKEEVIESDKYRVFAKNGLIIRDEPEGVAIGKFNFGEEITITEKTNIEFSYEQDDSTIDGYWYKTKKGITTGYVFSAFLVNTDACSSIFSSWENFTISKGGISFMLHGQCYFSFPVKVLNKDEVELIWSPYVDCVFSTGLWQNFEGIESPKIGKPFAKYSFKENKLRVTYYYPDWVKKYIHYPAVFGKSTYDFNYNYLSGNSMFPI